MEPAAGGKGKALWRVRCAPEYWCDADLLKWLADWGWTEAVVVAPPCAAAGGRYSGWLVRAVPHEAG
eukprot:9614098-Alexandrium_andersonii.AAC.1